MHRELTGQGQFVDVSAVEVLTSMIGDSVLEQALTGQRVGPDGNHHPDMSPHGCYPCAGGDWISIAVADDAERRGAARGARSPVTARPTLTPSPTTPRELAHRLRSAGVAAAKSATSIDVIGDELLWERGAYRFVSDHVEGQRPVLGPSWRMSRNPALIERGAPDLGEHNDYVFSDCDGAGHAATSTGDPMTQTLAGTVALVTGASSGIGAATARALAAEGAAVALLARRADRLDELKAEIEAAGGTALATSADVTDADQVAAAVAATVGELGRLDTLVNNAGLLRMGDAAAGAAGGVGRPRRRERAWRPVRHARRTPAPHRGGGGLAARRRRCRHGQFNRGPSGKAGHRRVLADQVRGQRIQRRDPAGTDRQAGPRRDRRAGHRPNRDHRIPSRAGAASAGERTAGMVKLQPEDIADAVLYMVTRDRRVAVNEMLVRSAEQTW